MKKINIVDFPLFVDLIKSINKVSAAAKLTINQNGVNVYTKNSFARVVLTSNAIISDQTIELCFIDINMLFKVCQTIKNIHQNDYIGAEFGFDGQFLHFKSKKFKTKLITTKEDIIVNSIDRPITAVLTPVFEFKTNSDKIKDVNSNSFIFNDPENARVYLNTNPDMENNVLYAQISNNSTDLSNSLTMSLGLVTFGALEREITIDFDRLNMFNIIQSDEIKIQLMDKNVLVSEINKIGKKDTFFKVKIYNSIRKS